jgi:hypothetical protein
MGAAVSERGVFWAQGSSGYNGSALQSESRAAGSLIIDEQGHVGIDLEGQIVSSQRGFEGPTTIMGILKDGRFVCVVDARFSGQGSQAYGRLLQQKFDSTMVLIGEHEIQQSLPDLQFDALQCSLDGMEKWLELGAIEIENIEGLFSARHRELPEISYDVLNGKLSVVFQILKPRFPQSRRSELTLKERASIRVHLNVATNSDGILREHRSIHDFVILVSNVSFFAGWPRVKLAGCDHWYDLYSLKSDEGDEEASVGTMFASFPSLRDKFGALYNSWRQKGESFRAGFYLYAASRRSSSMYEEHRFISIIWGLEAFHRVRWGGSRRTHLVDRLTSCIRAIPVDFEEHLLKDFCSSCVDLRNQLSHHGGEANPMSYPAFIEKILNRRLALEPLYHALILDEIGVESKTISDWITNGPQSNIFRSLFFGAGLIGSECGMVK